MNRDDVIATRMIDMIGVTSHQTSNDDFPIWKAQSYNVEL